ncbi:MAG: glutamine--tRNA ligase, partial [Gammaproteobacteria bacterium]
RGYPSAAVRLFCDRIGVTKNENTIEMNLLEACVREELDAHAPRRMAVLDPIKVTIENFPEGAEETLNAPNHPKNPDMGSRDLVLTRELFIDRADYKPEANKKFKRLVDGGAVRLRNGYVVQHVETVNGDDGEPVELRVRYFPDSLETNPEGLKVRGVIHWVSATRGVSAEVRVYDRLFREALPGKDSGDFLADLDPGSLRVNTGAVVEPGLSGCAPGEAFQFEREGYYAVDPASTDTRPVFNLTVGLRESRPA